MSPTIFSTTDEELLELVGSINDAQSVEIAIGTVLADYRTQFPSGADVITIGPEDCMEECRNQPGEDGVRPPFTGEQVRALLEAAYTRIRTEHMEEDDEGILLEDSPPRAPRRRLQKGARETSPALESEEEDSEDELDEDGNLAGFIERDSEGDSEESFDGSESDAWSGTSEEESGADEEDEESGKEGSSESGGGESDEDGVEIVGERSREEREAALMEDVVDLTV